MHWLQQQERSSPPMHQSFLFFLSFTGFFQALGSPAPHPSPSECSRRRTSPVLLRSEHVHWTGNHDVWPDRRTPDRFHSKVLPPHLHRLIHSGLPSRHSRTRRPLQIYEVGRPLRVRSTCLRPTFPVSSARSFHSLA